MEISNVQIIPYDLNMRPPNLHVTQSNLLMRSTLSALNNIHGCFREFEICLILQMQRILMHKHKTVYVCLLLRKAVSRSLIIEAMNCLEDHGFGSVEYHAQKNKTVKFVKHSWRKLNESNSKHEYIRDLGLDVNCLQQVLERGEYFENARNAV